MLFQLEFDVDDENSCFKMDLTQMVVDIQKQLKTTVFIITHNFCYNNIVKKPSPGTPLEDALVLTVRGAGPHPDVHGHPEIT